MQAFEIVLPSGAVCRGERDSPAPLGLCILLHDVGQDLDHMRPMADELRSAYFGAMLVDLPGHGMSNGCLADDGYALLPGLLDLADSSRPVTVVGEGDGADLILRGLDRPVTAVVLLSPRSDVAKREYADSPIRDVPTLVLLDPYDAEAVRVSEVIRGHARAPWGRIFAHRAVTAASGAPLWPTRTRDAATRFLAEKAAFALHPRVFPQHH